MVMGAALLWGISATAAKYLLNRQVDTLVLVQSRVTFSALLLLAYYCLFRRSVLRIRGADVWRFALLGILGVVGSNFTYYFTIRESTVATAILIQYTAPLLVMAYGAVTHQEKVTAVTLVAAAVSLAGCFLAVGGYDTRVLKITPIGLLTGAASIVCWAFLTVYTRHMLQRYSVWTTTFYGVASGAVFWLFINPPWVAIAHGPSGPLWGTLVLLAIISVLIPHTLYFAGLRHVAPSRAIITSTLEPVVAIISAAIVLQELLEPVQVAGALFVLLAIMILQLRRGERDGGQHAAGA
jgi:drug/metabolite transporter (DMT)-like permease